MYLRWMADNMWLFVPAQGILKEFFDTLPNYPMQQSFQMNPASISSQSLMLKGKLAELDALKQKVATIK